MSERYTLISSDGHAGADLRDYRPYLPSALHREFDAWAVRTVRRECNDELKKLEREHKISEDDGKKTHDQVQKLTDRYIAILDEIFHKKQAEVMEV